jgi:hypothetical protein
MLGRELRINTEGCRNWLAARLWEEADMEIVKRANFLQMLAIGITTATICWGLLSTIAFSKEVKVGTTTMVLPTPPGYCELDSIHTADARAISVTERMLSRNRLLAFSADCEQLAEYRTTEGATPLDKLAQYR